MENNKLAPQFSLNGLYVKDISFENPFAPAVFLNPAKNPPKMGVNIDVAVKNLQETSYEVALKVTAKSADGDKTIFLVEVLHAGVFTIDPAIDKAQHSRILLIDCAAVIFPFARRIVSDLTAEGGFPPLLLEPINFEAIYQSRMGQAA